MRSSRILLTLAVIIAVLRISTVGFCLQPESKETGDLTFSGSLEVEFVYTALEKEDGSTQDTSTFDVGGLDIDISAGLANSISADATLSYEEEEDESQVTVDEAYLSLVCPKTGIFYSHLGKMDLPFADGDSDFITDPFAHDLGEIKETVFSLGAKYEMIDFEIGIFNGDFDKIDNDKLSDDDSVDDFFAALVIEPEIADDMDFSLSVGYISDITDTDEVTEELIDSGLLGYSDRIGAYCYILSASAETGSVIIEYVTAEGEIREVNDMKPKALNIEVAATFIENHTIAIKYERTKDYFTIADKGDMKISRLGVFAGYQINENASVGLEYITAEDDSNNKFDTVTTKVGLEF